MKIILLTLTLTLPVFVLLNNSGNHPLPKESPLATAAHAHNDYQHDHPLWDALHCGFTSIEVDVRLVAGIFFVAHDPEDIRPFKTLRSMYLDPLRKLTRNNNGNVYQDGSGIVLLIDIKTDGVEGWSALQDLLKEYEEPGKNAITFLVSGNRDLEAMVTTDDPKARYDGRLDDLLTNRDLQIISLISAKWTDEFAWRGNTEIQEYELVKLKSIIEMAHTQGRKVRFWDTDFPDPEDQKRIWDLLLNTGVDYIGTDKLEEYKNFSYAYEATSLRNNSMDFGNQSDVPLH